MRSENITVLGQYQYEKGGTIQLFIGPNMKFGTEHSTQIHEMYHMHLTNTSILGSIINLFELERTLAEDLDTKQTHLIKKFIDIISQRTIEVQEVYANTMELLWIREKINLEAERNTYNHKTKKYKEYCDTLTFITDNQTLSILEKQQHVNLVCMYAMNVDSLLIKFLESLCKDQLSQYFNNKNHPFERLKDAIKLYKNGEINLLSNGCSSNDLDNFIEAASSRRIFKYLDWNQFNQDYNEMLSMSNTGKRNLEDIVSIYNESLEESTQVFALSGIKVFSDSTLLRHESAGIFILKNCSNLEEPEKNYYLIDHIVSNEIPRYISQEASKKSTMNLIQNKLCVALSLHEYDVENSKPKYFDPAKKLTIVIIEDYQECNEFLNIEIQREEIYLGDLYDKSVNNFFTVLFFVKRKMPNTIFIFPTTKRLAQKIVKNNHLCDRLLYSNQKEFLKIFSWLSNEANMLEVIHWIMVFLTNTTGKFATLHDPAVKLHFDFTRTLMNTALEIKKKTFYQELASLPTLWTVAQPFYTLMEFKDQYNTGNMVADTEQNYPLFFHSEQDALQYKLYKSNLDNYQLVGIDDFYWNKIKFYLLKANKKLLIFFCWRKKNAYIKVFEISTIDKIVNANVR